MPLEEGEDCQPAPNTANFSAQSARREAGRHQTTLTSTRRARFALSQWIVA